MRMRYTGKSEQKGILRHGELYTVECIGFNQGIVLGIKRGKKRSEKKYCSLESFLKHFEVARKEGKT